MTHRVLQEAVSPPAEASKRSKPRFKLAVPLISTLLFLAVLEGGAYLWERAQGNGPFAWELVASRRLEFLKFAEPGAGYTLMKPGSRYCWQGIPVEINSHGLRGPVTPHAKRPNTFRILNLGDSVAMGWGVRAEESYGRQLEILLNGSERVGLRYEVINAAVPGWNLENALAYLQVEGMQYEPDLVLCDMTVVNDVYGPSALEAHRRPPLIEWLRSNTYFWPFLTVQIHWAEAMAAGRERIGVIAPPLSQSDTSLWTPMRSGGMSSGIWFLPWCD